MILIRVEYDTYNFLCKTLLARILEISVNTEEITRNLECISYREDFFLRVVNSWDIAVTDIETVIF